MKSRIEQILAVLLFSAAYVFNVPAALSQKIDHVPLFEHLYLPPDLAKLDVAHASETLKNSLALVKCSILQLDCFTFQISDGTLTHTRVLISTQTGAYVFLRKRLGDNEVVAFQSGKKVDNNNFDLGIKFDGLKSYYFNPLTMEGSVFETPAPYDVILNYLQHFLLVYSGILTPLGNRLNHFGLRYEEAIIDKNASNTVGNFLYEVEKAEALLAVGKNAPLKWAEGELENDLVIEPSGIIEKWTIAKQGIFLNKREVSCYPFSEMPILKEAAADNKLFHSPSDLAASVFSRMIGQKAFGIIVGSAISNSSYPFIMAVYPSSDAAKKNIAPKDQIFAVNGIDVRGKSASEIINILSKVDSVEIVLGSDKSKSRTISIVRTDIK